MNILCFQKILRPVDGNVPEDTNVVNNVQLHSISSANEEDYSSVSSESESDSDTSQSDDSDYDVMGEYGKNTTCL